MADIWEAPKTNWVTTDGIGYDDLNRIEQNTESIRDATKRRVHGFGFTVNNSVGGYDGIVNVKPGSCYSSDGFPINRDTAIQKNLNTWAQGNGVSFGGMASAVTVAAHTWYYMFIIMNPTDGSTDIMFDDNPSGTNVSSGTFTKKRYVGAFKTKDAGSFSSFNLVEMYSENGDDVYINPNDMYTNREIQVANSPGLDNQYQTVTLNETVLSEGYALPERVVEAKLSIRVQGVTLGLINSNNTLFSIPLNLVSGGVIYAEAYVFVEAYNPASTEPGSGDIDIIVGTSRQIFVAMYGNTSAGFVDLGVRGFRDLRLQ